MGRRGTGDSELKNLLRTASSRRFGSLYSKFEFLLLALFGVFVAGLVGYISRSQSLMVRLSALVGAVLCMLSVLSAYRMAIPFFLGISYGDMLRIRKPFYVWTCCVFLLVCASEPFLALFSNPKMATILSALFILAVVQEIEYFKEGNVRHLFVSFFLAGVTVGLSAFGLCTFAFVLVIPFLFHRNLLFQVEQGDWSADESAKRILERSIDPFTKTIGRTVMIIYFFIGFLVVIAVKSIKMGISSAIFSPEWVGGLSFDGVIVLAVVGVVPQILALCGLGKATDTMQPIGFGSQVKYALIGCVGIGFLFFGEKMFVKTSVPVVADSSYWLLGMVLVGFALLTSVMVAFVDIWCRATLFTRRYKSPKNKSASRFCRLIFLFLPIVLVVVAFGIRFHSVF